MCNNVLLTMCNRPTRYEMGSGTCGLFPQRHAKLPGAMSRFCLRSHQTDNCGQTDLKSDFPQKGI